MIEWIMTLLGSLAAIIVAVDVIRRWKPFKWWLPLGYWFNAQAWGTRDDTLPFVEPSCWGGCSLRLCAEFSLRSSC